MKKILFIQNSLKLGGAEKFIFEIQNVLLKHKEEFSLEILTLELPSEKDFFYDKNKSRNIKTSTITPPVYPSTFQRILKKSSFYKRKRLSLYKEKIKQKFNEFDCLVFNDINKLKEFQNLITNQRVILHELCHKFQYESNPYFNVNVQNLDIIYMEESQKAMINNIQYNTIHQLPIVTNLSCNSNVNLKPKKETNIAVISRIHPNKAPTIFINLFKLLIDSTNTKYNLFFIGGYNKTTIAGKMMHNYFNRIVSLLKLDQKIAFLGEQKDLKKALLDHNIDFVWGISINEFIGYSSIEAIETGVPCLFWDCNDFKTNKYENTIVRTDVTNVFLDNFVHYANDLDARNHLLKNQLKYISELNDVEANFTKILNIYK